MEDFKFYTQPSSSPKLIILVGIPLCGRSYWCKSNSKGFEVISRDNVRVYLYGSSQIVSEHCEEKVTEHFKFRLKKAYLCNLNVILDNSNCSEAYIDKIIATCPIEYEIEVRFFDISLFWAMVRNYIRWMRQKKLLQHPLLPKWQKF